MLGTFRVIAQLPPDSLGAYVISMAHTASDVLAVVLLQVRGVGLGWRTPPRMCSRSCCCRCEQTPIIHASPGKDCCFPPWVGKSEPTEG